MPPIVTRPTPPFTGASGALEVHQVPAATDNLVWIVVCTATREAAIVDGPGASEALAWCDAHDLRPHTILNTHTHHDHVGINRDLLARGALQGWRVFGPARTAAEVPGLTVPVDERDIVALGRAEGRVLLTEGHVDGHVSYLFGDLLFCGDTLFAGGCGRIFQGGPERMFRTLVRLASLPGDTRVCCAHEYTQDNLRFAWLLEPDNDALAERIRAVWALRAEGGSAVPSRLEDERATNPFLRPGSPTLLRRVRELAPDADLSTPAAVFAAVRGLKDRGAHAGVTDVDLPL